MEICVPPKLRRFFVEHHLSTGMETWCFYQPFFVMFTATLFFGAFCWQRKPTKSSCHHMPLANLKGSPKEIFAAVETLHTSQVHVEMRYAWSLSMEDVSWRSRKFGVRKKSMKHFKDCWYQFLHIGSTPHPMVTSWDFQEFLLLSAWRSWRC